MVGVRGFEPPAPASRTRLSVEHWTGFLLILARGWGVVSARRSAGFRGVCVQVDERALRLIGSVCTSAKDQVAVEAAASPLPNLAKWGGALGGRSAYP